MPMVLNIIGGIIAGVIAILIHQWVSRPRLDIVLCPQKEGRIQNGSQVAIQYVRVINREHPRFLRRFFRRNDAHSCYAWVVLHNPPDGSYTSFCRAQWLLKVEPPQCVVPDKINMWFPSHEMAKERIDIGSGGAGEIAIVKKIRGEAVCYVASAWDRELPIGRYTLEVEVRGSGLPTAKKKFLLENSGTDLEESFVLKEWIEED